MEAATKNKNNVPQISLGIIDRILMTVAPKFGLSRIKSKLAFHNLRESGYITPAKNKRSMRGWFTRSGSADVDTLPELEHSRAASRDLFMNTPIATGAIRRMKSNAIGAGLTLQSRIDREFLGLSDEEASKWERNTEREFRLWAESKNCDATRTQTFGELQQLAFTSMILSGDLFVLLPFRKIASFPYELALKFMEGDLCQTPNDIDGIFTDEIRGGIEIDGFGAPKAYWFRTKHPGDTLQELKWKKVRAFAPRSGRRQVLHLFEKERPGQRRGMPMLAPVVEILKQATRLSEAELMGAIIASYFTVFITKENNITEPIGQTFSEEESVLNESSNSQDKFNQELAPGMIMGLGENEKIQTADPNRPSDAYEPFFNAIVKQIGAALEIPFELLMLSFNSSYSASRAAILEGWKTFRAKRQNFVSSFCQPTYEEWLTEAVVKGRVAAPGFFNDPIIKQAWCKSKWGAPGMGQIDPKKETDASIALIEAGLSTYEDEAQKISGGDWDGIIERKSREVQKIDSLGLTKVSAVNENNELEENEEPVGEDDS